MTYIALLIILLLFMIPIFVVMGILSIFMIYERNISLIVVPQAVFEALDSFILLAVPFYVLAGNIMKYGGISDRLINLASALIGWVRGGIGAASVLTCMLFSTMSGSSSGTTAAVGGAMIPSMVKRGYPKPIAASIVAVGGELGSIIPPSLPMIVYGLVANVSIGALFIAGVLPGILIGVSLILTVCGMAAFQNLDRSQRVPFREWAQNLAQAFYDSILALTMPIIILGGIYSGIVTPTEAAVLAVVYGFFIGTFVYRELHLKQVIRILRESAVTTSIIMLIVAFASLFGYVLTIMQIPQDLGRLIVEVAGGPITFLLLVNVFLLLIGTFMEPLATILILGPILAPIAASYGIDPVHFGLIMIVNVATGMITPPVAINLSIASQIAGVSMDSMIRPLLVFLAVLTADVLIISYIPAISLFLLQ